MAGDTAFIFHMWILFGARPYLISLVPFPKQALVFTCLQYKSFENTVGKGDIARNEQFLLFPQCFQPFLQNCPPFSSDLELLSVNSFNMEVSKFCRFGKGQGHSVKVTFYIYHHRMYIVFINYLSDYLRSYLKLSLWIK